MWIMAATHQGGHKLGGGSAGYTVGTWHTAKLEEDAPGGGQHVVRLCGPSQPPTGPHGSKQTHRGDGGPADHGRRPGPRILRRPSVGDFGLSFG